MRNGMCNSIAPCVDGVVVLVAVRTSQCVIQLLRVWMAFVVLVAVRTSQCVIQLLRVWMALLSSWLFAQVSLQPFLLGALTTF